MQARSVELPPALQPYVAAAQASSCTQFYLSLNQYINLLSNEVLFYLLFISCLAQGALGEAAASLAQATQGLREAVSVLAIPPPLLPGRDVTLLGRDLSLAPHFGRQPPLALGSPLADCFVMKSIGFWVAPL